MASSNTRSRTGAAKKSSASKSSEKSQGKAEPRHPINTVDDGLWPDFDLAVQSVRTDGALATGYAKSGVTITSLDVTDDDIGGGADVDITGTHLDGVKVVLFGTAAATDVTVVSATHVTCKAPAHAAGTVNVKVDGTRGAAVKANAFTYHGAPTVPGALSPATGGTTGGDTVTINGTELDGTTGVTFGGSAATDLNVVNAGQVTCKTPAHGAGAVDVVVTTPYGSVTKTGGFTYS